MVDDGDVVAEATVHCNEDVIARVIVHREMERK